MATNLTLLPMYGRTCGNRSPVTCHLHCDSACAREVPNPSMAPTFRDVATRQLSRRRSLPPVGRWRPPRPYRPAARGRRGCAGQGAGRGPGRRFGFHCDQAGRSAVDAVTVPAGYEWNTILRWGDPLFWNSPAFDPNVPNADAQELQFGYNNDYTDVLVQDRHGRQALLICNHEYVNRQIMFPPLSGEQELEVIKTTIAAHGMSVVELERKGRGRPWHYIRGARKNRRITAATPFRLTGPAAGSELVKTAADPSGTRIPAPSATAPGAPRRGARSCRVRRTSTVTSSPTRTLAGAGATG